MKITLDSVRSVLRDALGRDSFVASFINRVQEDPSCPTACISADGVLRYNPTFTEKYVSCSEDLFCLVLHEIMHPMFGHFIYKSGPIEALATDMVINASISLLFANASGNGNLFKKTYRTQGIEGLLRPLSQMGDSRYAKLYHAFYGFGHSRIRQRLSTGEVIQSLKVLTPADGANAILLLGSHGEQSEGQQENTSLSNLSQETLCRIAEDLKKSAQPPNNRGAGYGENLFELFIEAIKTHLSIRKVLLQKFATKQKMDQFRQAIHRSAVSVSPVPLHPSKRDFVLLAAGIPPFHYHNHAQKMAVQQKGLAIYLDVSGSVNNYLPEIIGVLEILKSELTTLFLFSNTVVETPFKKLLAGHIETTYGTDFDCIADSIIEKNYDKAVILTDGHASLAEAKQLELKKRKLQALTILFGGKKDCEELDPFGEVLQLEDVTH